MIAYFKELLQTLKKIEQHLATISKCVREPGGWENNSRPLIITGHWNDSV